MGDYRTMKDKANEVDKDIFCYIFGYGSLMYPSGINGRGLAHKYIWEDLYTATLCGYKRGMFANYAGLLYYGIMKSSNAVVEGVLVPIFSKADFEALLINECAHDKYKNTSSGKIYEITDVTKLICRYNYLAQIVVPIHTLVNEADRSEGGRIPPWYIADVWHGILPLGQIFMEKLRHTGIIQPSNKCMKMRYVYNVLKFTRRIIRR